MKITWPSVEFTVYFTNQHNTSESEDNKDDEERINPAGDISGKAPRATHTRIRGGRQCEGEGGGGGGTLGH